MPGFFVAWSLGQPLAPDQYSIRLTFKYTTLRSTAAALSDSPTHAHLALFLFLHRLLFHPHLPNSLYFLQLLTIPLPLIETLALGFTRCQSYCFRLLPPHLLAQL